VEAVVEVMPFSGGLPRNMKQCIEDFDIPVYYSSTVSDIRGKERVSSVIISKVDENRKPVPGTEFEVECDTLMISAGLIPENELTSSAEIPLSRVTSGALVDEHRQTEHEGIFACGNVLQVHDLVDYVSDEAEIAGKSAAEYVKGNLKTDETVKTAAGNGVRYVLPQRVTASPKEDISLFLRVTEPFGKVKYTVKSGDEVLATAVRLKAAPGEMEKITVKAEKLNNITEEITVSLEEVQ
ncbi:MAG: FAD-dependent oxidoreductase, partial [Acutalibacteraceae bacterium]|nr:FAD-dependent oxidoreductase [Acutalibacteraceae bacterium]